MTRRDWASEQGYRRDLAERALAHTVANPVEAAYHRTDLLDERRPMMQAWADGVSGALMRVYERQNQQIKNVPLSNKTPLLSDKLGRQGRQ